MHAGSESRQSKPPGSPQALRAFLPGGNQVLHSFFSFPISMENLMMSIFQLLSNFSYVFCST